MIQPGRSRVGILAIVAMAGCSLLPAKGLTQLVPDGSLGAERSVVTPNVDVQGLPADLIEGGARRGASLFHSFTDFNVAELQRVYFANPAGVENIISRVTGTSPSNLLGTLGVTGTANLFLINPNGIVFGPNATLDIRGSFVASTADRLQFENGVAFSASNPEAPPLLTVNVPIGLQYGSSPGGIRVQGGRQGRLEVGTGQTLALVGGEVLLDGGRLAAGSGRIELGSVAAGSLVSITPTNPGWELGYQGVQQFQDIRLTQAASVDASGDGGGSIQIQGRRITVADGSVIVSQTQGTQAGKNVTVRATELLEVIGSNPVDGSSSALTAQASQGSTGNAGNLTIETGTLFVANGAGIGTSTFGPGNGGDLTVRAQSVEVVGFNSVDGSPTFLVAQANRGSTGNAGNLTIDTGSLRIADGARVSSGTAGVGRGGELSVRAQSVEVVGSNPISGSPSSLNAQANRESTGNAGNLTVNTGTLRIADGGQISSSTFTSGNGGDLTVRAQSVEMVGSNPVNGVPSFLAAQANRGSTGNAGNLTIDTGSLRIADGARVSVGTAGAGNGGDLTVRAQLVELIGAGPQDISSSALTALTAPGSTGNAGNLTIETGTLRLADGAQVSAETTGAGNGGDLTVRARSVEVSGFDPRTGVPSALTVFADSDSTGDAGDIVLITDRLHIANQGEINATGLGAGSAGNITVQAASQITLTDEASINSNTNATQGNITLNTPLLSLRRNSSITTNATGVATGGNINIDAGFIVSSPNENNDIIANAFEGSGGQITLTAQNIFWFDLRTRQDLQRLLNTTNPAELNPRRLPTNDVTAFSQANPTIDTGAVIVQTPDLDPTRGLTTLPTDLTDPSQLIASTCPADQGSSFSITGRGGLPEDPRQPLMGQVIWQDERGKKAAEGVEEVGEATPIVEAQTWTIDRAGTVVLIARQPQTQLRLISWYSPCSRSRH